MRTRTRNALAAGLLVTGLAFAPLTNAQLFDGQRSHGDSKAQMLESELVAQRLSERVGPHECADNDGDGTEDSVVINEVTFECTGVDVRSFIPNEEIFAHPDPDTANALVTGGTSDVWGWTSPETGDEYAIVGASTGAAVFRVTDADSEALPGTEAAYLGHVVNNGANLIWFDIKVNDDHAYIVSESPGMGMKILDLTLLDSLPAVPAGTTVPLPVTTYPLDLVAHNVVIDEASDMLYLVGSGQALGLGSVCATEDGASPLDNAGLHAVDISEPKVPVYVGCHVDEGYVHDAHCATYTGPDTDHAGASICITAHEDGVAVVDVTDPTSTVTLSDTTEEDYPRVGYSHQGWMSEDQAFYFHGDEGDENGSELTRTFVFDIRDLDDIQLHFVNEPGGRNIDHNMYTHDGLLYQSNYTTGLQVFDTASVADRSLPQVAEFDVFPDDDADEAQGTEAAIFAGTWSHYPYFASGVIPVTATEDGVWFLALDPALRPVEDDTATASLPDQAADEARSARTRGGR